MIIDLSMKIEMDSQISSKRKKSIWKSTTKIKDSTALASVDSSSKETSEAGEDGRKRN